MDTAGERIRAREAANAERRANDPDSKIDLNQTRANNLIEQEAARMGNDLTTEQVQTAKAVALGTLAAAEVLGKGLG